MRSETDYWVPPTDFDARLVTASFGHLIDAGPEAAEYFFRRLFAVNPDIESLFPMDISAQRERFFAVFARLVQSVDAGPGCAEMLARMGRGLRKFGVTDRHYTAFSAAMLETASRFITTWWRSELEAAWRGAVGYMAATMRTAAAADAAIAPPWWIAEIAAHELRSPGVAVLTVAPTEPMRYLAGQYIWVQVTRWPRVWRQFSAATAPRPGGLIELHVRAVPGGLVSNSLVYHSAVGDTVLLGSADGNMTLTGSDHDLLCVAGGTGLAPIKAIIEQAIARSQPARPRKITLFYGARQYFDLYDLQDLQLLESAYPALRVIPVLSDEPGFGGLTGMLPDVVHAHGGSLFENCDAYICGPRAMVRATAAVLSGIIPPDQIHHDPL